MPIVFQELRSRAFCRVLVVLKSVSILSENKEDLETLVNLGLTAKVISDLIGQSSSVLLSPFCCCSGDVMVRSCS